MTTDRSGKLQLARPFWWVVKPTSMCCGVATRQATMATFTTRHRCLARFYTPDVNGVFNHLTTFLCANQLRQSLVASNDNTPVCCGVSKRTRWIWPCGAMRAPCTGTNASRQISLAAPHVTRNECLMASKLVPCHHRRELPNSLENSFVVRHDLRGHNHTPTHPQSPLNHMCTGPQGRKVPNSALRGCHARALWPVVGAQGHPRCGTFVGVFDKSEEQVGMDCTRAEQGAGTSRAGAGVDYLAICAGGCVNKAQILLRRERGAGNAPELG